MLVRQVMHYAISDAPNEVMHLATSKPRITVTFEPRTYEVLSRMAASQGESMSQLVAGLVELAVPSFERVLVVVERAATASDEVKAGMRAALDRAERDIVPQLVEVAKQHDMFLSTFGAGEEGAPKELGATLSPPAPAKRPRRGASGGAGEVSTPVPVTRGSGAAAGATEWKVCHRAATSSATFAHRSRVSVSAGRRAAAMRANTPGTSSMFSPFRRG